MIDLQAEIDALANIQVAYHLLFPSYITHIRFPRYKNLSADACINFDFPITALVGANGSGKTSALNALYGAPLKKSTGQYWFSTVVDPIEEGEGSPNRFIYGHYNNAAKRIVETRKARVRKVRNGRDDPNYWEPTKEAPGDGMAVPPLPAGKKLPGRSLDRWNPVSRKVLYINFRKELSAFDKYFYFGKDPVNPNIKAKASSPRKILTKNDQVRYDATLLARVIASGTTAEVHRKRKIATENRLLVKEELDTVSFVLGREYSEARWIKHRLFKGDGGLSIVFKTKHARYSEAFAGSGEVAVASCVVQVLGAAKGTLVLLDEPEVSLHPGAQERLLAFLANIAKKNKLQVIFSTHSPHLISALPDCAIKTFTQLSNGHFSVIGSTHPYAAFRRLGAAHGNEVVVLVEDLLAQAVVTQALQFIDDEAERQLFHVEFLPGGAASFLTQRIPVLMESKQHVLVLLDGDQKRIAEFTNPNSIPEADNATLEQVILDEVGVRPAYSIDGNAAGGSGPQKILAQRRYLTWAGRNLKYLPTSSPEELVLKAASALNEADAGNSQSCKATLHALAEQNLGRAATSVDIDQFGQFLLGTHRHNSLELTELAATLRAYLAAVRPQTAAVV
jgi:energy-coupling factor transporter ATP-binding protein EcfA2